MDPLADHSPALSERYGPRILIILAVLFALAYGVLGDRLLIGHVGRLELDAALRGALVSGYDPAGTMPLTVVAIDDATASKPTPDAMTWNFTDVTPRDKLAQMLAVIAHAGPSAIVVDIDLSDESSAAGKVATPMDRALMAYLESYQGPSLIFIKRGDLTPGGAVQLAPSALYDGLIAARPALSWAHATYTTDPEGTVRRWAEWLFTCTQTGSGALPSVPLQVLATWPEQSRQHYPRPAATATTGACVPGFASSASHAIMYDEGLSGRNATGLSRNLSKISAWQVLDSRIRRDDQALFSGRVVVIGGTRSGTGDTWRTPVGELSGVELIANIIRFAPGQLRDSRHALLYSLLFFATFCVLQLLLRPVVAIAVGIALSAGAIYWFGPYGTLDALQNAIILFVELTIVEECIHLWLDVRTYGWRFLVASHWRESGARAA